MDDMLDVVWEFVENKSSSSVTSVLVSLLADASLKKSNSSSGSSLNKLDCWLPELKRREILKFNTMKLCPIAAKIAG